MNLGTSQYLTDNITLSDFGSPTSQRGGEHFIHRGFVLFLNAELRPFLPRLSRVLLLLIPGVMRVVAGIHLGALCMK